MEFAINPAGFHHAFAADLPETQTAVLAATQRPVAGLAFSEPCGPPAWKTLPSWAVAPTPDKAAGTDALRSMAGRAGAGITELDRSLVIMISQLQAVSDVILAAPPSTPSPVLPRSPRSTSGGLPWCSMRAGSSPPPSSACASPDTPRHAALCQG